MRGIHGCNVRRTWGQYLFFIQRKSKQVWSKKWKSKEIFFWAFTNAYGVHYGLCDGVAKRVWRWWLNHSRHKKRIYSYSRNKMHNKFNWYVVHSCYEHNYYLFTPEKKKQKQMSCVLLHVHEYTRHSMSPWRDINYICKNSVTLNSTNDYYCYYIFLQSESVDKMTNKNIIIITFFAYKL